MADLIATRITLSIHSGVPQAILFTEKIEFEKHFGKPLNSSLKCESPHQVFFSWKIIIQFFNVDSTPKPEMVRQLRISKFMLPKVP